MGLFQHLSNDRLAELVQGARVVSYEPNEAVVEFGEEASFLGVLLEGELSASVVADGGQRQVLGHLKAGDTFGEMALMSGDKTMADFIAETALPGAADPGRPVPIGHPDRARARCSTSRRPSPTASSRWRPIRPRRRPRFAKARIPTACV